MKPIWQSKTIWLAVLQAVANIVGVASGQVADPKTLMILNTITAGIAFVLRLLTDTAIGGSDSSGLKVLLALVLVGGAASSQAQTRDLTYSLIYVPKTRSTIPSVLTSVGTIDQIPLGKKFIDLNVIGYLGADRRGAAAGTGLMFKRALGPSVNWQFGVTYGVAGDSSPHFGIAIGVTAKVVSL